MLVLVSQLSMLRPQETPRDSSDPEAELPIHSWPLLRRLPQGRWLRTETSQEVT